MSGSVSARQLQITRGGREESPVRRAASRNAPFFRSHFIFIFVVSLDVADDDDDVDEPKLIAKLFLFY